MSDEETPADGAETPPAATTSASMESARRFLYDEDEPPPGNPANTPVQPGTSLSASELGGKHKRLNPVSAAMMSTLATCRGFGLKRLLILGGAVLAIIFIALGISALGGGESKSPKRQRQIKSLVVGSGISNEAAVDDSNSPQGNALAWLANVDKTSLDSEFLTQRYALAVLFYATSGTTDHIKPVGGWIDQTNWMGDQGYCSWHGVKCGLDESDKDDQITEIVLSANRLTGSITDELAALEGLITLDLSGNSITGTLPTGIASLDQLNFVLLGKNSLIGPIPPEYGLFASVREFDVGHNQLTGTISTELLSVPTLRKLGLEENLFKKKIPDMTGNEKLETYYIQGNQLSGKIPESLSLATTLVDLRMSENHLVGTMPAGLNQLTKLQHLHAASNKLRGDFPAFITELSRLEELKLQNNTFSSSMPDDFSSLLDLKVFNMERNELTGSIPTLVGRMSDLETFDVSFNHLTGYIPTGIDAMQDLEEFGVRNNKIKGPIPTEFGTLHKLRKVLLGENKLWGKVPSELGNLKELRILTLEHNELSGAVPPQLCDLDFNNGLYYLQADCDTGNVECSCCTTCF